MCFYGPVRKRWPSDPKDDSDKIIALTYLQSQVTTSLLHSLLSLKPPTTKINIISPINDITNSPPNELFYSYRFPDATLIKSTEKNELQWEGAKHRNNTWKTWHIVTPQCSRFLELSKVIDCRCLMSRIRPSSI